MHRIQSKSTRIVFPLFRYNCAVSRGELNKALACNYSDPDSFFENWQADILKTAEQHEIKFAVNKSRLSKDKGVAREN